MEDDISQSMQKTGDDGLSTFNSDFWFEGFKEAYKTGELSDLTLIVNDKPHRVHKIIITRKSDFFKNLVMSNVHAQTLHITDPTNCIEFVLEYLYLGSIRVQPSNIDALLNAAEYFGIPGLITETMKVVQSQFSKDKDLIFLYLSRGEHTRGACSSYIREHFTDLWEAGCFDRLRVTDLSPKELYEILMDEKLVVQSEQDVFSAIMGYIKRNKSVITSEDIGLLLSAVRFSYIGAQSLIGLFNDYKDCLPKSWFDSILSRLCNHEKIAVPPSIKSVPPRDSYAKGVAENYLNHIHTGGTCRLIEYNYYNGASPYNPGTLDAPPNATWANNGCLMDSQFSKDNSSISYRVNSSIGSTWTNSAPDSHGTAVLVVDLTTSPEITRTLRRFCIFQMVSDGATTGVQISSHPNLQNAAAYADPGWIVILPWSHVGPAAIVANPPGSDPNGNTVKVSSEYQIDPCRTRFLKIELRNDGTNGHPGYIELRQIKAYSL
jgi:hypothetical protein